jgi:hypothetical protein
MNRTTKQEVKNVFKYFIENYMNGKIAEKYNDVGGYRLDYNPIYGGYVIERIESTGGGISCPFGHGRLKASEFVQQLNFYMHASDYKEQILKKEKSE